MPFKHANLPRSRRINAKRYGKSKNISSFIKTLTSLTLLHQAGALSYEITHGVGLLKDKVPPDKFKTNFYDKVPPDKCKNNFYDKVDLKSLNSTSEEGELMKFYTNSANLCVCPCVTGG